LSDASLCSWLDNPNDEKSGVRVPIVDVFRILQNQSIDLLKIDLEGYELAILGDSRMSSVSAVSRSSWNGRTGWEVLVQRTPERGRLPSGRRQRPAG